MSVLVTLKATVKPNQFEKLVPFLEDNLPRVRSFPGALNVSILYDRESDGFLIYEEWLTRKHHQDYIAFISENGVLQQLASFLTTAPDVGYYERLVI